MQAKVAQIKKTDDMEPIDFTCIKLAFYKRPRDI